MISASISFRLGLGLGGFWVPPLGHGDDWTPFWLKSRYSSIGSGFNEKNCCITDIEAGFILERHEWNLELRKLLFISVRCIVENDPPLTEISAGLLLEIILLY